jgi:3-oxoadipate enol-lactonase
MNKIALSQGELAYIDRGRGTPVLLLHGFPLDHTMWKAQIAALAVHARVIAPDLRGFGESPLGDVDPQHKISMEQYANELNELLDALEITEPIVLVGFSMGGYIAWQFMRKYGHRLRALVQCDTRAGADTEEGRAGRIKMADNVAEVRRVVKNTSPAAIAAAQRGMAARPDVTALLPTIEVPTLVLVGDADAISPPAEMQAIAAAIPDADFVVIPNSGHMTTMENSADVNHALVLFIDGLK